ncbi:hypothetical protein EVAR_60359_1 [Eumeta japonica]|uniref:Uncharacterized protein n=1 Tax=Eumeta variegata TaxID=151549 RepID=A0A4C1Z6W7_EUMVA|nr:hypothetical protein EVAR_60359_1 [Eumeta japonica]
MVGEEKSPEPPVACSFHPAVRLVDSLCTPLGDDMKTIKSVFPVLPDYAPPAFSSSPDAEAAARSGVLAPTRCERPASPFIMSYESEQIRLGSLFKKYWVKMACLCHWAVKLPTADSESTDPLPDELHNSSGKG